MKNISVAFCAPLERANLPLTQNGGSPYSSEMGFQHR